MNIKIGILNVPKHCNKHDLIHFVTIFFNNINCAKLKSAAFTAKIRKGTWTHAVIILKS